MSLSRDIPNSDIDLLAVRNRLLVRKELHPALQYLLLEAMHKVHSPQGPFNRIGEFPAEQPNDLPLTPTAEAFYHSGPTFWQRYMSFWLASLLNRIVFFIIPVVALLIPLINILPRLLTDELTFTVSTTFTARWETLSVTSLKPRTNRNCVNMSCELPKSSLR